MTQYKCKECGFTAPEEDWDEADTYCEECEWHSSYKCPQCQEIYDGVFEWEDLKLE